MPCAPVIWTAIVSTPLSKADSRGILGRVIAALVVDTPEFEHGSAARSDAI